MIKDSDQTFYLEPDPAEHGRDPRLILAVKILKQMQDSLGNVVSLLESGNLEEGTKIMEGLIQHKQHLDVQMAEMSGTRVVEGVFDGCNMVGPDGNLYQVPSNYSSKSRLVEGDLLKLTIKKDGGFIFKQIAPIERRRVIGKLAEDPETHGFVGLGDENQSWKLLRASISYFHGVPGDEVVLLVPKSTPSSWAAVENVVKR